MVTTKAAKPAHRGAASTPAPYTESFNFDSQQGRCLKGIAMFRGQCFHFCKLLFRHNTSMKPSGDPFNSPKWAEQVLDTQLVPEVC
jgi:hypothetical protein